MDQSITSEEPKFIMELTAYEDLRDDEVELAEVAVTFTPSDHTICFSERTRRLEGSMDDSLLHSTSHAPSSALRPRQSQMIKSLTLGVNPNFPC